MKQCHFDSRLGQSLSRSGAVISDPRVELRTDGSGGEREQLGVLYQAALDGSSVRFGLSYYPEEDLDDVPVRENASSWVARLSDILAELEAEGFTLSPEGTMALQTEEERWGIGWLAWRRYARGAVPTDEILLWDFRRVLVAYDGIES